MLLSIVQHLSNIEELLHRIIGDESGGLSFSKVSYEGIEIKGKIKMVRLELEQQVEIYAHAVDRRGKEVGVEPGTAQWSVVAADADGNPIEGALTIEANPENEMRAMLRSHGQEATAVVTLRADGDIDVGEDAMLVATLDVIVDAGNAIAIQLSGGVPTDFVAPEPEPAPEDTEDEGEVVEPAPEEPTEPETPVEPAPEEPTEPEVPVEPEPAPEEPTEPETPVEPTPEEPTEDVTEPTEDTTEPTEDETVGPAEDEEAPAEDTFPEDSGDEPTEPEDEIIPDDEMPPVDETNPEETA